MTRETRGEKGGWRTESTAYFVFVSILQTRLSHDNFGNYNCSDLVFGIEMYLFLIF